MGMQAPDVYSAFDSAGLSIAFVAVRWINQAFLDCLNWPEVQAYVAISLVGGIQAQACFLATVFVHLGCTVRDLVVEDDLQSVLHQGVAGFRAQQQVRRMQEMMARHHVALAALASL